MSKENAKKLLEELNSNAKAVELLKAAEKPKDGEGMGKLLAQIAAQVGIEADEATISEAMKELEEELKAKTDAAIGKVEKLSDEALDTVAGGGRSGGGSKQEKGHPGCKYDFIDLHCAIQDACSAFNILYVNCSEVYHDSCDSFFL